MKPLYDPVWAANYFDNYGLRERNRLIASPVNEVSLLIHTHYLEKYISPGDCVLEIGAGAGRFTQILANLDTRITVGDISLVQLDLNRMHTQQFGFAQAVEDWLQLDISEMSQLRSDAFECVVACGCQS